MTTITEPSVTADETVATDVADLGPALLAAFEGSHHDRRAAGRALWPAQGALRDPAMSHLDAREWTLNRLRELGGAGFGHSIVPPDATTEDTQIQSLVDFETISYGDLSVAIKSGVQHGLFGGAIAGLGNADQHERFLTGALDLSILGCFAMTERGHGSDVASLETTINYDAEAGEFVVDSPRASATKTYIGNAAAHGHMAAVFGQLVVAGENHGVHCILVPIRDADGAPAAGVTIGDNGHKGGLLGVDNGTLSFDHVRVGRDMLLDRFGSVDAEGHYVSAIDNPNRRFFSMLGALVRGRICIGAGAAIAARRALSIATRYADSRRQFRHAAGEPESPLLDYLAHQRKLLPAIARAYALGFAQNDLISAYGTVSSNPNHDPRDQRALETMAAGMKAMNTEFANGTIQTCREACGGVGYMSENQLTQLRSDVDVFATFEGDNTVLLQLVAKGVLTNYREVWGGLDRLGLVQASARMVGSSVIERTGAGLLAERLVAAARRKGDAAAFYDRGWHAWMFEERERHSIDSLARRMRAADRDSFDAVNAMQDHVLFVARAHMERVVLDSFIAGIAACPSGAAKQTLEELCTLFALSSLEADAGWFLSHNRMSDARAKALRKQINQVCRDLRPRAIALVEGLGVPAEWLGAAMLTADA
ncbi:acyl-CoA dehydrogenase [Micropruina sonneratiae]|uniref:acyl-CoA dehydrogenase family protein n=1 Tax=Micropruina sonneratiae TaxID=2986940 RepID=UPI0022275E3B|nr:acyl-CoA dehydrogenase [Micropruina sp. KQZ13P-5]MCW3159516.1 acyl-CoA dehydrogenase family protein [Micropruina sp. KQZ13P-5]